MALFICVQFCIEFICFINVARCIPMKGYLVVLRKRYKYYSQIKQSTSLSAQIDHDYEKKKTIPLFFSKVTDNNICYNFMPKKVPLLFSFL